MDGSSFLTSLSLPSLLAQADAALQSGANQTAPVNNQWETYGYGALFVLGIFVFPFIVSRFVTKAIRMPQHSFRLGVMLAAISGGFLFAWANNFTLQMGPDIKGGTNLVYDIVADESGEKLDSGALASALSDRINPSGVKEITIRPRGESQIEIIVPMVDEFELQKIKDLLQNSGQLEFRIVANSRDHRDIIELARQQAQTSSVPKMDVVNEEGTTVARWYTVGREEERTQGVYPLKTPVLGDIIRNSATGQLITNPELGREDYSLEKWLDRQGIEEVDVLMALESLGEPYAVVNGDDLASAQMGYAQNGLPVVEFRLNSEGAGKMLQMTVRNQPDGEFHRRMAIVMDKKVLSAPQLNSPISNNGQITGQFTKEEVEFLVTILRSGRLPATLSPEPASENRVGAGLGATTIEKGTNAAIWSIIVTFACILVYYRFSGIVASFALVVNGLLIFGVMVFIGQPLTLPGLAGLVLTLGMSVDANVLIFERIREERAKGSAPRMSIRNGFDRALTTIIDSNLTTLIAAIVLYWIGTDQVRGFAVALIVGIATSMFTATFCSRIIFEIAEKLKFVSLSMADGVGFLKRMFWGEGDIHFMRWQKLCAIVSLLALVGGTVAVIARGKDILNIDFTGGTSVTFQLQSAVPADELRRITREILDRDEEDKPVESTLVRVEKDPPDTVYTLVTSISDINFLSRQLIEGFAKTNTANLVTYRLRVLKEPTNVTSSTFGPAAAGRLTAFQQEGDSAVETNDAVPQEEPTTDNTAETSDGPGSGAEANTGSAPTQDAPESEATSEPAATAEDNAADQSASPEEQDEGAATEPPPQRISEFVLQFEGSNDDNELIDPSDKGARIDGPTLRDQLIEAASVVGVELNQTLVDVFPEPMPSGWREDDVSGHSTWIVRLPVNETDASRIVQTLESQVQQQPKWLSLSKIGTRVAGEMQQRAIGAILVSLIFIVAYIWFRFQKVAYGLAAVVALVHDVGITLGILALCHWLAGPLSFLLIEDFKIGLTEVAAFLTIIGYSLNDTIVVFDRIREVRGRSPRLTPEMVNTSVNQTLSRTLLTSSTTLLTILLLYIFGGEGIHAFSFALLIGVVVGTYSSIFIAAPVLLWFSKRGEATHHRTGAAA